MYKSLPFICLLASLSARPHNQPPPVVQGESLPAQIPAGYSMPAAIDTNVGLFVDAAFTYQYISEEGLKFGNVAETISGTTFTTDCFPSFAYEPGFNAGIGYIDRKEWVYRIDYSWAHTNRYTLVTSNGLSLDDWTYNGNPAVGPASISSSWNCTLQVVDITSGRPFYLGRYTIASLNGGLELNFLDQSYTIIASSTSAILDTATTTANSWSIGPVASGEIRRLLPYNFYCLGSSAFSLLYTTYTTLNHTEVFGGNTYVTNSYPLHAMRPVAKAGLGLGYNHCFQRAWYIDLAVSYEFSLYWSQNMLRWLVDTHASEGYDFGTNDIGANPQDLFLQGLVVSLQMNF